MGDGFWDKAKKQAEDFMGEIRAASSAAPDETLPTAVWRLRARTDEAEDALSEIKAIIPPDGVSYCYGCKLVTPRKHAETRCPGYAGEKYGQVNTTIVCANCGRENYGRDPFVERLQKILYGESSWELRWDENGNPREAKVEGSDHA